jgi:hypothetical protein
MKWIACVYWEGKFRRRNENYTPEWVYKLYNMSVRNMQSDFQFICLTNVPDEFNGNENIKAVPLLHNWRGWWSKIELFRPNLFNDGDSVLYMDIDSIIVKSSEPFFNFDSNIVMSKNADGKNRVHLKYDKWEKRSKTIVSGYSSTTFLLKPPFGTFIYHDFNYEKDSYIFHGDQDWIHHKLGNAKMFPDDWVKKLRDCKNGILPKEIIVVAPLSAKILPNKNESAIKLYKWAKEAWQ